MSAVTRSGFLREPDERMGFPALYRSVKLSSQVVIGCTVYCGVKWPLLMASPETNWSNEFPFYGVVIESGFVLRMMTQICVIPLPDVAIPMTGIWALG